MHFALERFSLELEDSPILPKRWFSYFLKIDYNKGLAHRILRVFYFYVHLKFSSFFYAKDSLMSECCCRTVWGPGLPVSLFPWLTRTKILDNIMYLSWKISKSAQILIISNFKNTWEPQTSWIFGLEIHKRLNYYFPLNPENPEITAPEVDLNLWTLSWTEYPD